MLVRRLSTTPVARAALKKPAYDFKKLSGSLSTVLESARRRELPAATLERIAHGDAQYDAYKTINYKLSEIQQSRNAVQLELNKLIKEQKASSPEFAQYKQELAKISRVEKELSKEVKAAETEIWETLETLPNDIDASVKDEVELVRYLNPQDEYTSVKEREHSVIGQDLGIIDLRASAVVSGASWYYLIGDGALLEQALVQYALKLARKHNYTMVTPPSIVRTEISNACGFKPRDQNNEVQTYQLPDGLCLTGTAEVPLAGSAINKTFSAEELPRRVVGVSRSYRAEAGARGRDTKGLYRVHEFTKVELFVWSDPETSMIELEKLRVFQEDLISSLGLSARVLNMPANDLGAPATKKYDIEAWMPGRGDWGELTSTSNCTDYQSRRMHTKVKTPDGKSVFVHTLNGTAMAVPRVIVAIIEKFFDPKTKRIAIPKVLQPYMDDKEYIEKK